MNFCIFEPWNVSLSDKLKWISDIKLRYVKIFLFVCSVFKHTLFSVLNILVHDVINLLYYEVETLFIHWVFRNIFYDSPRIWDLILGSSVFTSTTWKVSKYGVFSSPYFPAFGLNMDQKNSVFGHFSRSVGHPNR